MSAEPNTVRADDAARGHADDLLAFVDASPTPFHAVTEVARRLTAAGFRQLERVDAWPSSGGHNYVIEDGALVAWVDQGRVPHAPLSLVGAHSDSPGLRLKPSPTTEQGHWRQLAVEVYGGPLLNSWLNRELGLAGRVAVDSSNGIELRLLHDARPLLYIPQLAIHLDREINDRGLQLDRQRHLTPVWALDDAPTVQDYLAQQLAVRPDEVRAFDLMLVDLAPSGYAGLHDEFIAAPRLDNLCSCHAGLTALLDIPADGDTVPMLVLFDHEEVGSTSARGAAGSFLSHVVERSVTARGGTRDDLLRALAGSWAISADMAHATHPNYAERHDPNHTVRCNAGPVLKVNANQRYATDAPGAARFSRACEQAAVPMQHFVSRNDLPCGSTIGPALAAQLGVPTADVGVAQLSMHAVRELCGALDPHQFSRALHAFLALT